MEANIESKEVVTKKTGIKHHISNVHHTIKKTNGWKLATIVLAVCLGILLIVNVFSGSGDKNKIAKDMLEFVNTYLVKDASATLKDVSEESGLYRINIMYQSKEIPIYATKDGKNIILSGMGMVNIEDFKKASSGTTAPAQEIPKTDKPIAKSYIFSYCPYGSQFIKAMLPVYDLLKNKVDIQVVAIGAMHGEFEHIESLRQICVEKLYGKDKLWAYFKQFYENSNIGNCAGDEACVSPLLSKLYSSLSIDSKKIETCMKNDAPAIYEAQGLDANEKGITGSPGFSINEVESQVTRTPEAIKEAICKGFTTEPSECTKTLSTQSPDPGFGTTASTSNSSASC